MNCWRFMKKLNLTFLFILLLISNLFADYQIKSDDVRLDTGNFTNNLSSADDTVQKAFETYDKTVGGSSLITEKAEFTFKSFTQNIAQNTTLIRVIPFACTITGWEIYSDISGSIVVDILKSTTASPNAESFTSIAGTELPTLVSAVRNAKGKRGTVELTTPATTISSWTTAVAAGSSIQAKVNSASAGNINGTVRIVVYLERT